MTTRSPTSSSTSLNAIGLVAAIFLLLATQVCSGAYYGKLIGKLSELHHGVSGEVYAVDGRTLFLKDFTYDGEGPAAYFYAGNSKSPNGNGFRLRDERGTTNVLKRYRKKDITLTLPDGKSLSNIKWFSVWCDEFSVNFGDVKISRGFDYPKPQKLPGLNGVHGVSSEPIVIVDAQTLLIPGFSYDGEAPDAKFWVGAGPSPSPQGIRVPDENGKVQPLRRYDHKTIVLTLPGDLTIHQLGHFGVWCEAFTVDFGHVQIPQNLNVPPSLKMLGVSPQNVHRGGQGQTLGLLNLYELSSSPSSPSTPSSSSSSPSSLASSLLLQQYQRPTTYRPILRRDDQVQVVQAVDYHIPKNLQSQEPIAQQLRRVQPNSYSAQPGRSSSILDYGDDASSLNDYQENVRIGGSYQLADRSAASGRSRTSSQLVEPQANSYARVLRFQGDRRLDSFSKLNCEVLEDKLAFEVRWAVAGDSIVVQLVGKLDAGQYMSFGISANPERSMMVGGDVVVAWVDKETLQGYAMDYFLDAKSQCSGGRGSCPDTRILENTNSVRLLNAAMVNGYSIVTYQRPLKASDELDHQILTNGSQAIIWAIGPLNERLEVSFHSDYLKTDRFIEFGRPPTWNCPIPDQEQSRPSTDNDEKGSSNQELTITTRRPKRLPPTPAPAPKNDAWEIPPIQCYEPDDGVLYAQMGPTGGKHGYPAITGHVGWGISWYINGLLIPEINVVRGKNYTFVVEGGQDPEIPARYHPFYITDDPIGGYQHKTSEEKADVKIFAGVRRQRGTVRPTGVGRLCNWVPDQNQPLADEFDSFGAYQRTLTLECDHGEPGFVEWTPDENTPDTVYYQCFTHRYLGWKINVHDSCDASQASASENHEVYVDPNSQRLTEDLDGSSSIRVSSKVTPTAEFLQQHLHHPHREYGLRYPHHSTTNPGKLSTSYTQILTNANNNNNYERLQSSSSYEEPHGSRSSYSTPSLGLMPHRHEVRVKDAHHAHLDEESAQQQHHHHHHHQQLAPIYRETLGGTRLASYPTRQQIVEIDQDTRQTSNQQLSNLVADNPRPLSQGTKYTYPPAGAQILYSRPQHPYATNYYHLYHPLHHHHHHHQPEQKTQLMIVKRPMLMRRPMLQNTQSMPSPTIPLPSRPIFVERKKAVYRLPTNNYRLTSEKLTHGNGNLPTAKLKKIDTKQRVKLESKVSEVINTDDSFTSPMKPARNTGFDPDSIVIEGGFKPIVRNVDRSSDIAQKRISDRIPLNDAFNRETDYHPIDNFEPMFIPSPPVSPADLKRPKKKTRNTKPRLDEIDDMEMAADRVEAYYLPPAASARSDDLSSPSSSGVLITYDGKKLKDTSLAMSISGIEEHSKSRLSSDVLSRTPQFGRFKGELPPPIPGEIHSIDQERRPLPSTDLSVPELQSRRNTKLTLVGRSKRSYDGTDVDRKNVSNWRKAELRNQGSSILANAGEMALANFGYIVLTAVFYFII